MNTHMLENIADELELQAHQLLESPQSFYTFNNCPNSNGGTIHGTQNVYNIDKDLLDKIINLIDKVTNKL